MSDEFVVPFIVPSITLIFFISSKEVVAFVKFATAAVVGLSEAFSVCAIADPDVRIPSAANIDKIIQR
jgi:hypothetical protein